MKTIETQRVVHRALDGTTFTIAGGADLSRPFTSACVLTVADRWRHELVAGERDFGEHNAATFGIRLDEEFSTQGGRLRVGHAEIVDRSLQAIPVARDIHVTDLMTMGVWQGRSYSLSAHFYNATTADALSLFDSLSIVEHAEGISVMPKKDRRAVLEPGYVLKEVPGAGLLELRLLNRGSARVLPRWSGTALPHGELFRDALPSGDSYFIFASSTTVVQVVPDAAEVSGAPTLLAGLSIEATV